MEMPEGWKRISKLYRTLDNEDCLLLDKGKFLMKEMAEALEPFSMVHKSVEETQDLITGKGSTDRAKLALKKFKEWK